MQSTYEISDLCEFEVKEFNLYGHHIKSVTFDKPEFQITLTKTSIINRSPDKIITITNGPLPIHMFSHYRDTYSVLIIESTMDGIITIEYEKNKPLYTPEEIQCQKDKQEKAEKYYEKYYDISPSGELLIKDLDVVQIYVGDDGDDRDKRLYELMYKNWGKETILNTKSARPVRYGDIFNKITVDSDVNTTLNIVAHDINMQIIDIKKGKHEYNVNSIMHFLIVYATIIFEFDDVVNSVEFDYIILPQILRQKILLHTLPQNFVKYKSPYIIDVERGYIYMNGLVGLYKGS